VTKTIDFLPEDVISDGKILSGVERDLLSSLIERARTSARPHERHLPESIARLAGELIAERIYGNLATDIEHQLLAHAGVFSAMNVPARVTFATPPSPPAPAPTPGSVPHGPNKALSVTTAGLGQRNFNPPPPSPPAPVPEPGSVPHGPNKAFAGMPTVTIAATNTPNQDLREVLTAQYVLFEEFLAPEELQNLLQDTLRREMEFQISEVIAPGVTAGAVDFECRRSQVLMDTGRHRDVILNRLQSCLPRVFEKLGLQPFWPGKAEVQITASNHGDFFRCHSDNGHEDLKSRELTFVYFFHREPKKFEGGELRIYDSRWENGAYVATKNYRTIVPLQNQIILFPSSLLHEITPVECSSKLFKDSRFTVNGWFHH